MRRDRACARQRGCGSERVVRTPYASTSARQAVLSTFSITKFRPGEEARTAAATRGALRHAGGGGGANVSERRCWLPLQAGATAVARAPLAAEGAPVGVELDDGGAAGAQRGVERRGGGGQRRQRRTARRARQHEQRDAERGRAEGERAAGRGGVARRRGGGRRRRRRCGSRVGGRARAQQTRARAAAVGGWARRAGPHPCAAVERAATARRGSLNRSLHLQPRGEDERRRRRARRKKFRGFLFFLSLHVRIPIRRRPSCANHCLSPRARCRARWLHCPRWWVWGRRPPPPTSRRPSPSRPSHRGRPGPTRAP